MQGYWFDRAGAAADVLQFGDLPDPQAAPGEVRVRVAFSAVNPTDVKRRADGRELAQLSRITPNNDGSGVIDAVGDGVDQQRIGQRVWLFAAQAGRPCGTGAQYCVVPSNYAVELPENTGLDIGACLGVPAVTAHRALFADGTVNDKSVLITGGTGRVGRYAVQMALLDGATVVATAGTADKAAQLAQLGVQHVINYRNDDLVERVLAITDRQGVDRMVDVAFGMNIARVPELIRPNGQLTSYGSDAEPNPRFPFIQLMYKNILVRPFSIMGMPMTAKQAAFGQINRYLRDASLNHQIGARFTFSDMINAHQQIEAGTVQGVALVEIAQL